MHKKATPVLAVYQIANHSPRSTGHPVSCGGRACCIQHSWDTETLRILLNNLIDNAIRYAGAHAKIDMAVRDTDQGVVLEVCDNGPGTNAAERERVLE
jgi:signal transduction histidine kinase